MGLEQSLLKVLYRLSSRPTLEEALQICQLAVIHNEALKVASWQREDAIEINTRLRELGHRPPLNHRDFLVGGVGVGLVPISEQPGLFDWFAFSTWNTKRQADGEKECAEKRIGHRMLQRGCTCVLCLAVVGELNTDGDGRSGRHGPGPTLDPCEMCRDDMRGEFYPLYRLGTVVLTEHPATRIRSKPRTVAQLMAHHQENWWEPNHKVIGLIRGR